MTDNVAACYPPLNTATQAPDGQTPRDMRLTFGKQRLQPRTAIEQMIDWNPERIILAHGRWYERDGSAELGAVSFDGLSEATALRSVMPGRRTP